MNFDYINFTGNQIICRLIYKINIFENILTN